MEIKRNQYLDATRAVASIFVVLIHCVFPGEVGIAFKALARFAVPLFFMISGYFLYNNDSEKVNVVIPHKVKRLLLLALVSGIGYFLLEIAESIFLARGFVGVKEYFITTVTWGNFLRFLVTNTPLVYMPRWFLYALVYCYLFLLACNKVSCKYRYLYISGLLTMICHLVMEILYGFGFEIRYQIANTETFISIRNFFLLRAFPWFLLGYGIRQNKACLKKVNIHVYESLCMGGVITTLMQCFLVGQATTYLGTMLIVIGVFGIAINKEEKSVPFILMHVGRNLSMYVYILHGAVISAISLFEKIVFGGIENEVWKWIKPCLVIVISITVAEFAWNVTKKSKIKGKE